MEHSVLQYKAQVLLRNVVRGYQNHTQSSHTLAIYDTAWVSMIAKTVDEEHRWAFPESFQFLLEQQQLDGSWDEHKCNEDGILNTLAALLAMKRHEKSTYVAASAIGPNLQTRLSKAVLYLQYKLQQWDVQASIHVGFEILVPSLLSMLEQEHVVFEFPQKQVLMNQNAKKLKNFDPAILYGNQKTTFLHSLEAFIGKIDFDKVQHHRTYGSLMCSPSSTAAYMMNCTTWDAEAEKYIKDVIMYGRGHGNGGVPSVYPCTVFELTWVASTLIQAGFTTESLGNQIVKDIISCLDTTLQAQQGLLGFAPSVLADGDDTAKAIITLNLIGQPTSAEQMISIFKEGSGHLLTYPGEGDPSFSANCNGLMAILRAPNIEKYLPHVENITNFLCNSYLAGAVKDKWNTSPQYSMMLLAETLMHLIQLWNDGTLELLPQGLVQDRILIVLIQILNRTLFTQHANGSWSVENSPEVNAYSILTLLALQDLPHARPIKSKIQSAIQAGRQVLVQTQPQWDKPQYLWVEKVMYGSSVLAETYCLAAMNSSGSHHVWSDKIEKSITMTTFDAMNLSRFFNRLPEYSDLPGWKIVSSVVEGSLYLQQLREARSEIFPRQKSSKDKYLTYIPCTWIIVNNCAGFFLNANLIWDMMVMSMQDFLVDEYMESEVVQLKESDIVLLQRHIKDLCKTPGIETPKETDLLHQDGHSASMSSGSGTKQCPGVSTSRYSEPLAAVEKVITRYVREMIGHPRIQKALLSDQRSLQVELEAFLLSHIDQIQDNQRFGSQESHSTATATPFQSPRTNHYVWSHTTAANHTSCAVSFAFYSCRLASDSNNGADLFPTSYSKYMARDLCSHLAVMSRLYNDYASIPRDRAELNLNSVNFPEFHSQQEANADASETTEHSAASEAEMKKSLLTLAQYERSCVKISLQSLKQGLKLRSASERRLQDALALFVGVTELYADMYVARDLTNRISR